MKILILALLISSSSAFALQEGPKAQAHESIIQALWSIDSLEYALETNRSAAACQSVGVLNFILRDLKSRTIEGMMATGSLIKNKNLVNIINKTLPYGTTVCASKDVLDSEDFKELESFKNLLRAKLKVALPFFN